MSALPCRKFNLESRGIIAPGYYADLALLDLDRFSSPADYAVPNRKAEGVKRVYVNGQLAFAEDTALKTNRPGRMLRVK
jgi:N-acyl-D-aspartate/D-glutamate deacylase